MDAFAVSLGVSSSRGNMSIRPTFRLSFHFGLFQFLMPIIGWFIGYEIVDYLKLNIWIAFGLLLLDKYDLDLEEILNEKIATNSIKYPVQKSKGKATKYNELKP